MFCRRETIELDKKDDIIHLEPLGDIHLGSLGCDIDKYERRIKHIAKLIFNVLNYIRR